MERSSSGLSSVINYVSHDANRKPPRWKTPTGPEIKELRHSVGLSQAAFAERYGLSVVSLRKWEQNRATPEQASAMILRMIQADPERVGTVIEEARKLSEIA